MPAPQVVKPLPWVRAHFVPLTPPVRSGKNVIPAVGVCVPPAVLSLYVYQAPTRPFLADDRSGAGLEIVDQVGDPGDRAGTAAAGPRSGGSAGARSGGSTERGAAAGSPERGSAAGPAERGAAARSADRRAAAGSAEPRNCRWIRRSWSRRCPSLHSPSHFRSNHRIRCGVAAVSAVARAPAIFIIIFPSTCCTRTERDDTCNSGHQLNSTIGSWSSAFRESSPLARPFKRRRMGWFRDLTLVVGCERLGGAEQLACHIRTHGSNAPSAVIARKNREVTLRSRLPARSHSAHFSIAPTVSASEAIAPRSGRLRTRPPICRGAP